MHDVVRYLEIEHELERPLELRQQIVERLGLRRITRKPVEHEPVARVLVRQAVAHQPDRELVRYERARGENGLHFLAERRSRRDRLTEHVARRDVGDPVLGGDARCLGALPGTLRPENQDVHFRNPS